ncbi:MAG: DNA cytosine methyltransferase [Acidimicrobiales bacterium]
MLNAAHHGVPQLRPRLFVVGVPKGSSLPTLAEPSHGGPWERRLTGTADQPHVTAGEALADLATAPEPEEVVRGKWGHLLPAIPPGDNYLFLTERRGHPDPVFTWRSRYWSFLLKLDPARPSPTVQAQPGPNVRPFHWDSRRLRVPELKRLFTFPDDFALVGSRPRCRPRSATRCRPCSPGEWPSEWPQRRRSCQASTPGPWWRPSERSSAARASAIRAVRSTEPRG